jgi:hypothetical protein
LITILVLSGSLIFLPNFLLAEIEVRNNCLSAQLAQQYSSPLELNYTDPMTCALVSSQYGLFNDDPGDWNPLDPENEYYQLFRYALPIQYQNISDQLLFEWFGNVTEKTNRSVPSVQEAYADCGAQMCTGTSGNPDLTGIGVRTTLIFYKRVLLTINRSSYCTL